MSMFRRSNKVVSLKELRRDARHEALRWSPQEETDFEVMLREQRPLVREDCAGGQRPCPWVICRYHLFLDVTHAGSIVLNFPELLGPEELDSSCALDIADRGALTLDEVGDLMNLTRERIRQIEEKATRDARAAGFDGMGETG